MKKIYRDKYASVYFTAAKAKDEELRCPANTPITDCGYTADQPRVVFLLRFIQYSICSCSRKEVQTFFFDFLERTRHGCLLVEPTRRHPVLLGSAPPRRPAVCRSASTRVDPSMVFSGFGFDKLIPMAGFRRSRSGADGDLRFDLRSEDQKWGRVLRSSESKTEDGETFVDLQGEERRWEGSRSLEVFCDLPAPKMEDERFLVLRSPKIVEPTSLKNPLTHFQKKNFMFEKPPPFSKEIHPSSKNSLILEEPSIFDHRSREIV